MNREYNKKVRVLSDLVVMAQKPIRILDAIKWDSGVYEKFKASRFKEMPRIDAEYYKKIPLNIDPEKKVSEFKDIRARIEKELGPQDPIGKLLVDMTDQYTRVVDLLKCRGTAEFWKISRELYGSPDDFMLDGATRISSMGQLLYEIFAKAQENVLGPVFPKNLSAAEVVRQLSEKLKPYFSNDKIRVEVSDGIVADAAAGGDAIKINEGVVFSQREVRMLEVHEGWVHLGTTLNGRRQTTASWLAVGPPRVAAVQEGLAVLMEVMTFSSFPNRARRINDRVVGIYMAEKGANFVELFEYFRTQGYSEEECFAIAKRVCRGGLIEGGGPFTKDISYCKGFVENYNFLRSAIKEGRPELIPYLFVGKVALDDIPMLYQQAKEGVVDAPRYVPPIFQDLNGLYVWMGFSSLFNRIDLDRVQVHFQQQFAKYLS